MLNGEQITDAQAIQRWVNAGWDFSQSCSYWNRIPETDLPPLKPDEASRQSARHIGGLGSIRLGVEFAQLLF